MKMVSATFGRTSHPTLGNRSGPAKVRIVPIVPPSLLPPSPTPTPDLHSSVPR